MPSIDDILNNPKFQRSTPIPMQESIMRNSPARGTTESIMKAASIGVRSQYKELISHKYKTGQTAKVGDVVEDHGKALHFVSEVNESTVSLLHPVLGTLIVTPQFIQHCNLKKRK
jgi:hypothetical protein